MRSEQEIMNTILSLVERDERIGCIAFEGSRTNINIAKDEFQDYDITYLDSDLDSFIASDEWLRQFDHLIMLQ